MEVNFVQQTEAIFKAGHFANLSLVDMGPRFKHLNKTSHNWVGCIHIYRFSYFFSVYRGFIRVQENSDVFLKELQGS